MALFLLFPVLYFLYAPVCLVCLCVSLCLSVLSWAVGIVPPLCLLASALTSALIAHCCDFLQIIPLLFCVDFLSTALVQYFFLSILFISYVFFFLQLIFNIGFIQNLLRSAHDFNIGKQEEKQIIYHPCAFVEILLIDRQILKPPLFFTLKKNF